MKLEALAAPFQAATGVMIVATVCSAAFGHAQTITRLRNGIGYKAATEGIRARLDISNGTIRGLSITDIGSSQMIVQPELFTVTLKDGSILRSSQMNWQHPLVSEAPATAPRGQQGKQLCADLEASSQKPAAFHWCLLIRPHASYLRAQLAIRAGAVDLPITEVRLLDFHDSEAHVSGTVPGSPIVDKQMFAGFENPLSWARVGAGEAVAGIARVLPLSAGQTAEYSVVIGSAAPGQMRRSFLAYLESERPRPYRPFLHYNSWYDIGYGNRFDEPAALDRVRAFGTELVEKRHVAMDSFLFDDGWDNPDSLWQFSKGFPQGFSRVGGEAAKYNAGIAVWLSPWGGYNEEKRQRIAFGRSHGYEIVNDGYALSGPKYFQAFDRVCRDMIGQYGVNMFKFDGTGNAESVFAGSAFDSDFGAAIHLIQALRADKPGLFINLTTGTWASPFWLRYADSIWRGGEDHDFDGAGTSRQQWISYRDEQTFRNIVQRGPLFPLNSLMLHGIIYAARAEKLSTDPAGDFDDEVHSYFATGTQLEEMYITPSLLTPADWDILAKYARWSRLRAGILKDTHWVGGDPGKLEVYGWAAWSPKGWIVTLRNPSQQPRNYRLDLGQALELPSGQPEDYLVREPFRSASRPEERWSAVIAHTVELKPFEVRTFESVNP